MTLDDFWQLIAETVGPENLEECDFDDLQSALEARSPEEIRSFDAHFSRLHAQSYTWALWGAAYVLNGGCSDDGFDYFRAGLIGMGREVFEAAMEEPDSLADHLEDEFECEDLLYVASSAYQAVTGEEELPGEGTRFPDLGEGWDFDDEAEMRARYPKLCAKFF